LIHVQLASLVKTDITPEDMEKGMKDMAAAATAGVKRPLEEELAADGKEAKKASKAT
jgi:hypothetical protein